MPLRTTQQNMLSLLSIAQDSTFDLSDSLSQIRALIATITDPTILTAVFGIIASRTDDLAAMATQFEDLQARIEATLASPPPTT